MKTEKPEPDFNFQLPTEKSSVTTEMKKRHKKICTCTKPSAFKNMCSRCYNILTEY